MTVIGVATVAPAEPREWRCICCIVRPLFGLYTELGGLHIRTTGRVHQNMHYVVNLFVQVLDLHGKSGATARKFFYMKPEQGRDAALLQSIARKFERFAAQLGHVLVGFHRVMPQ